MRKKEKKQNRLERLLEMPQEVTTGEPKITMMGFHEILIENYKGILEYEDYFIKINTHIGAININGFHLNLNQLTEDDIMVTGQIESVHFDNITDEEEHGVL